MYITAYFLVIINQHYTKYRYVLYTLLIIIFPLTSLVT